MLTKGWMQNIPQIWNSSSTPLQKIVLHPCSILILLNPITRDSIMSCLKRSVLTEWKSANSLYDLCQLKGNFCNILVISVYAPILSAEDRDKDKL